MQIGTPGNVMAHRAVFVEQLKAMLELWFTPIAPYRVEGSP